MALRKNSIRAYTNGIEKFCEEVEIDPFNLPPLEQIEQLTEEYIMRNRETAAPKSLNVIYNAVKTWCFVNRLLKNRKAFAEIKFDKSSRKTDACTERALEPDHVKRMMQLSDAYEKIVIGLYGICGLRPALQPQLTVKQIHPDHYNITNGKLEFTVKNPFVFVPKAWHGNKAHITFFIILHSQIANLIEQTINIGDATVTHTTTLLSKYKSEQNIHDKIKEIYAKIGFEGRPYLLRTFADRVLDKGYAEKDKDVKEHMMGHKGKISAVYQFKQLTKADIEDYTMQYEGVEKYVNEKVFGTVTTEQLNASRANQTIRGNNRG